MRKDQRKEDYTPYTMSIPTALWRKFKAKCSAAGVSMATKLLELIKNFVDQPEDPEIVINMYEGLVDSVDGLPDGYSVKVVDPGADPENKERYL